MRGVSEVLSRLLETGSVNGQPGLLPGGQELSPAATGVMEQARTAVVLAAHLIADKVRRLFDRCLGLLLVFVLGQYGVDDDTGQV